MHRIAVIKGDGIGPEVVDSALRVLNSTGLEFEYVEARAGYACWQDTETSLPEDTVNIVRECGTCLFGAVTSPPNLANYKSAIVTLRRELDLYANVRPIRDYVNKSGVDFVIVRENTEGLYSGIEKREGDTATSLRVITRKGSERIARFAANIAMQRQRRVTVVHKANVLRESCGLFREASLGVLGEFDVEVNENLVDIMAYRLQKTPLEFDVILTSNLFGDILSDASTFLIGGMGMAPSGNIGDNYALFEPVHGSAPKYAGKDRVNPTAMMLATKMMLKHLGEVESAGSIENAIIKTIQNTRTADLGGTATTSQFTNQVIENMEAGE